MAKDKAEESKSGSTPRTDPEAFTYTDPKPALTAGQLRKAGYEVPETVKDDEIPASYTSSTQRTDAEPFLVQDFSAKDLVLHDKTPVELAKEQPAAKGGPIQATTLSTTPALDAIKNSKGSDAEKLGPRPKGSTLDVTPSQAAGTPQPEV